MKLATMARVGKVLITLAVLSSTKALAVECKSPGSLTQVNPLSSFPVEPNPSDASIFFTSISQGEKIRIDHSKSVEEIYASKGLEPLAQCIGQGGHLTNFRTSETMMCGATKYSTKGNAIFSKNDNRYKIRWIEKTREMGCFKRNNDVYFLVKDTYVGAPVIDRADLEGKENMVRIVEIRSSPVNLVKPNF